MDMFVDTWICGFQIILNITTVNKYLFCWDLEFVDCPTYEIYKIKCPPNKNGFRISQIKEFAEN